MKVLGFPQRLQPWQFFTHTLVCTQSPAVHTGYLINVHTVSWVWWLLFHISRSQLKLCFFVFGFQVVCHLAYNFISMKSLRKVMDFLSFFLLLTIVELFQILKDDAVKVLNSICQQIWKTQQWPQDWKRSVFSPIPKKGNAKECSHYCTIALISHASKVMLKILQTRLQQYVNRELPDVQAGFRKGRGTRDHIANIRWIKERARVPEKHLFLLY